VAWLVVGAIVGFSIGLFTDQSLKEDIMDMAYRNNPSETWAYHGGGSSNGGTLAWA
jgi:hypothetical protein